MTSRQTEFVRAARKIITTVLLATSAVAWMPAAVAKQSSNDIVRWVDADGVVHFGQRQFAPEDERIAVQQVRVLPANGMDVPDTSVLHKRNTATGQATVVQYKPKTNPRGFRGYDGRRGGRTHR